MSHLTTTRAGLGGPELAADWASLAAADPQATIFQSPRFLRVWADVLGVDEDVSVTTVTRDDELLGVVAGAVSHDGDGATWRFAGGTEVTDYTGPVIAPAARDLVLDEFVAAVLGRDDVDRFVFGGMPSDTGLPDAVATRLKAEGLTIDWTQDDVCPVVSVAEGWDAYFESLPGKLRQEQKRKARKLSRDLGHVSVDQVAVEDLEAGLATFFDMQADAASPKAGFFQREVMRTFFTRLADEFAGDDVFRLHVLSVGDRPAAATVSLVDGDRWGLYNSAFDPVLASFAPGMVLVTELIRAAADEGLATFDLLRGDEPYKYRFGAQDRDLVRLACRR